MLTGRRPITPLRRVHANASTLHDSILLIVALCLHSRAVLEGIAIAVAGKAKLDSDLYGSIVRFQLADDACKCLCLIC
jgi:hypothetical protein